MTDYEKRQYAQRAQSERYCRDNGLYDNDSGKAGGCFITSLVLITLTFLFYIFYWNFFAH